MYVHWNRYLDAGCWGGDVISNARTSNVNSHTLSYHIEHQQRNTCKIMHIICSWASDRQNEMDSKVPTSRMHIYILHTSDGCSPSWIRRPSKWHSKQPNDKPFGSSKFELLDCSIFQRGIGGTHRTTSHHTRTMWRDTNCPKRTDYLLLIWFSARLWCSVAAFKTAITLAPCTRRTY